MEYEYFDALKEKLEVAYATASEARSKGFDPEKEVEIKIAKDVAARVEGIVGPPGICEIIRNLEKGGMGRETIAFEVAKKIAIGEVIKGTAEERIEQAVRTGVAILTEGVLVAPTEGISKINIKKNPDGSEYVSVYYSGPIRSAGGTAAALSVVLADLARKAAGIGDYRATDSQIERYVEEVNIYEGRVAHLQYKPPEDDVRWISRNCPVCIDGEPTEDIEASVHRNIAGVETNRIRGGIPLVICEGIAQKAAKVFKYTKKLGLEWDWLEKIIKVTRKADSIEIKPDFTYLEGLVAGRPVFAYPSTKGGFRLRYGRSRTNGIMAKNVHPAIMVLLDGFLAYGTHMKIERPGKGCVISSCDSIDPPIIKLKNGSVVKVHSIEEAEKLKMNIDRILFLGDMLVPFGDFLKSNHPLIPGGWCEEWWLKEVEAKGVVPSETAKNDAVEAFDFSKKHNIPLHPNFTFNWENISISDLKNLMKWLASGEATFENGKLVSFKLTGFEGKKYLEDLFIEHTVKEGREIILNGEDASALLITLGMLNGTEIKERQFDETATEETTIQQVLEKICGVRIKPKAPTYIGARMGRPEKAKERPMDGSPNVLFPTGSQKNRSITKLYKTLKSRDGEKTTILELARYKCKNCNKITFNRKCATCQSETELQRICAKCNAIVDKDTHCDMKTICYDKRPVDIVEMVDEIKKMLGGAAEDVKGVKGLSNPTRIPERLEKGFLRAKYEVFVFRDGTSRFDATDVPLTHFIPKEIGLTLEKALELGYTKDYLGNNLTSDSQLVPLKHQDVLLSKAGAEYFFKVSKFIDEMLVYLYGLKPFYSLENEEELIGHLAAGLSPHTSAAALCRIIGITEANVGYAHPYFHTAKRRNCFYRSTEITIWDEKLGTFVRKELGRLVEDNIAENTEGIKKLGNGAIKVEVSDRYFAYGINPKTGFVVLKKIKCFIKTPAPKRWVRISTTTHREMIVTDDHNVLVLEKGKFKSTEAKNVKEGMDIPICIEMNPKIIKKDEINIAKELCALDSEEKEIIRIRASPFFRSIYEKHEKMLLKILPIRKFEKQPERWWTTVPISHMEILVKKGLCKFDDLPGYARIAMKQDNLTVPIRIKMNENLMRILGYYVAEGCARSGRTCNQIGYRICNKKMAEHLKNAIKDVFGKEAYVGEQGTQIVLCSRIIHRLISKIWNCGSNAYTKRVPTLVFSASDELVKAFVSAYFDGDGSVISKPPRMYFYSVSKNLLEDIGTLLLRFGIFCRYGQTKPRLPGRKILERYKELGKEPKLGSERYISLYGMDLYKFAEVCFPIVEHKTERMKELRNSSMKKRKRFIKHGGKMIEIKKTGNYIYDRVQKIEEFQENSPAYCLDVDGQTLEDKNVLLNNQILTIRCDGDEDCLILLMDALINFSRKYLGDTRGGTMDTPLVMSSAIDPREVDDEVHCMELVTSYPLEFYMAAEKKTFPGEIKIKTIKDVLGTLEQFGQIPITHHCSTIDKGVIRTTYVKLDSIPEKIESQFALQGKIDAVDQKDAAERLILSHFIPDLYGNLRSFSRQTFRCVNCNESYRRVPLAGKCIKCGGNLLLTINKGGIKKYLEISRKIIEDYGLPDYLRQRINLLDKEIKNIFEDDKIKQMGLSDFV